MTDKEPHDYAEFMNQKADGWANATGLRFTRVVPDEVVAELVVGPQHLQALGVVHGGVHCGVIETIASVGAAVNVIDRGDSVLGLENHTTFLRAVRGGTLRAVAKPLTRGRRTHVWEATIYGEDGRPAATGRVRLLVLPQDTEVAGNDLTYKPQKP